MVCAVFTYLIGIMENIWLLLVVSMISFGCIGFVDGGTQVFFLHLWGKEAMPFIQLNYFLLGLGCLAAPLVAEPFLTNRDGHPIPIHENGTIVLQQMPFPVHYAYAVISASMVICCLLTLTAWWRDPDPSEHPSRNTNHEADRLTDVSCHNRSSSNRYLAWKVTAITLHLIFVHLYAGVEIGMGSFLVTFAVTSDLHLSKARGSYLTSMFWSTFTFMKLGAMIVIPYIGNSCNMLLGILIATTGSLILVPFASHDETMLWIGVALIGIGMSSVYACTFRYLEGFFPVTSLISGLTTFFFISGEFTFPFLISALIEHEPRFLLWVIMSCCIVMLITYPLVMVICNSKLKR
jgi:FHS family Na+ dependent glucose MFS transporter 1